MSQIRINKTEEIEKVLAFLQSRYQVLSEAEIIKVALAEKFKKEIGELEMVDEETEKLIGKALEEYKKGKFTELKTDADIDKYLKSL